MRKYILLPIAALTFFQKVFVPNKLSRLHDTWLAGIKKRAEAKVGI